MLQHLDDPMPLAAATDEHRDLVLARVSSLRRKRRAALVVAPTLLAAAAVITIGWVGFGQLDTGREAVIPVAPSPDVTPAPSDCSGAAQSSPGALCPTPLPSPTGATLEAFPLCLRDCPTTHEAGRYRSALNGEVATLPFTVVLPSGWRSLDEDYSPQGSRSFSAHGDVHGGNPWHVSFMAEDGRSGIDIVVNPAVWLCQSAHSCRLVPAPDDYVSWLVEHSGGGQAASVSVGGRPATSVDLLPTARPSEVSITSADMWRCWNGWPCDPVVAYHVSFPLSPGTAPPTIGRMLQAPTRVLVFDASSNLEHFKVLVWLWDVGTTGTTTDEVLRNVTPILDTLRFEKPTKGVMNW